MGARFLGMEVVMLRLLLLPALLILIIGLVLHHFKGYRLMFGATALYIIILGGVFLFSHGSSLGQLRSLKRLADKLPSQGQIYFYRLFKPSLVFYLQRKVERIDDLHTLKERMSSSEATYYVMRRSTFEGLNEEAVDLQIMDHSWDKVLVTNERLK